MTEDKTMFCSKCGAQNVDQAQFCVSCGAKLATFKETTPPESGNNTNYYGNDYSDSRTDFTAGGNGYSQTYGNGYSQAYDPYSSGGTYAPPQVPMQRPSSTWAWVSVIAAIAGLIGWIFLPWITISSSYASMSINFFDVMEIGDAASSYISLSDLTDSGSGGAIVTIFLIASVGYIITAIASIVGTLGSGNRTSTGAKKASGSNIFAGICGIIAFICMAIMLGGFSSGGSSWFSIDVGVGFGLVLTLIGGIFQLIAVGCDKNKN